MHTMKILQTARKMVKSLTEEVSEISDIANKVNKMKKKCFCRRCKPKKPVSISPGALLQVDSFLLKVVAVLEKDGVILPHELPPSMLRTMSKNAEYKEVLPERFENSSR